MFPFIFDWDWSVGRFVFMGMLYLALTIVGGGLGVAFLMTLKSLRSGDAHGHH